MVFTQKNNLYTKKGILVVAKRKSTERQNLMNGWEKVEKLISALSVFALSEQSHVTK